MPIQFYNPENPVHAFIQRRAELRYIYEMPVEQACRLVLKSSMEKLDPEALEALGNFNDWGQPERSLTFNVDKSLWAPGKCTASIHLRYGLVFFDPPTFGQEDTGEDARIQANRDANTWMRPVTDYVRNIISQYPQQIQKPLHSFFILKSTVQVDAANLLMELEHACELMENMLPLIGEMPSEKQRKDFMEMCHKSMDKDVVELHQKNNLTLGTNCGCALCKGAVAN